MLFYDGQKVSYIGEESSSSPRIGDLGMVVACGNTGSHVKWRTGVLADQIQEVNHLSIVPLASHQEIDTFAGGIVSFSARDVHASRGPNGVLDALSESGHLASFEAIAEEALAMVASRVRSDPSIQEVLASIEPDAGDELVSIASVRLLQDAFRG